MRSLGRRVCRRVADDWTAHDAMIVTPVPLAIPVEKTEAPVEKTEVPPAYLSR